MNPLPDAGVDLYGNACLLDADCSDLGGNYRCKHETSSGNAEYPGGYCTRICAASGDCSNKFSVCITLQPQYGEADSTCWGRCSATDPCRPGYVCYDLGGGTKGCWLNPLPTLDAGPVSNKTGIACAANADCKNPPDDGVCRLELLADGGPTGLPGGECTAACRIDRNHCGDGGVCVSHACEAACNAPLQGQGQCRTGWVCGPIADAGIGKCEGNCNNPGFVCPQGFTCAPEDAGVATAGYCCDATKCL